MRCFSAGEMRTFLKQDAEDGADLLVSRCRHRLCSLTRLCLCKPDIWGHTWVLLARLHCLSHWTNTHGMVLQGLGHRAAHTSSSH